MFFGKPQFFGIRGAASNIGQQEGNYTVELFQQDFQILLLLPQGIF